MKPPLAFAAGVAMAIVGRLAWADEPVPIREAPGWQVVQDNCGICHSLDYLRINSVFMNRQTWETEVNKMINSFGAPIQPADAKTIIDYLSENYGLSR
jgi:hypothetical protein